MSFLTKNSFLSFLLAFFSSNIIAMDHKHSVEQGHIKEQQAKLTGLDALGEPRENTYGLASLQQSQAPLLAQDKTISDQPSIPSPAFDPVALCFPIELEPIDDKHFKPLELEEHPLFECPVKQIRATATHTGIRIVGPQLNYEVEGTFACVNKDHTLMVYGHKDHFILYDILQETVIKKLKRKHSLSLCNISDRFIRIDDDATGWILRYYDLSPDNKEVCFTLDFTVRGFLNTLIEKDRFIAIDPNTYETHIKDVETQNILHRIDGNNPARICPAISGYSNHLIVLQGKKIRIYDLTTVHEKELREVYSVSATWFQQGFSQFSDKLIFSDEHETVYILDLPSQTIIFTFKNSEFRKPYNKSKVNFELKDRFLIRYDSQHNITDIIDTKSNEVVFSEKSRHFFEFDSKYIYIIDQEDKYTSLFDLKTKSTYKVEGQAFVWPGNRFCIAVKITPSPDHYIYEIVVHDLLNKRIVGSCTKKQTDRQVTHKARLNFYPNGYCRLPFSEESEDIILDLSILSSPIYQSRLERWSAPTSIGDILNNRLTLQQMTFLKLVKEKCHVDSQYGLQSTLLTFPEPIQKTILRHQTAAKKNPSKHTAQLNAELIKEVQNTSTPCPMPANTPKKQPKEKADLKTIIEQSTKIPWLNITLGGASLLASTSAFSLWKKWKTN